MGRPQLGFPRLRFAAGETTGIAIRPDHNSAVGGCAAEPCEVSGEPICPQRWSMEPCCI